MIVNITAHPRLHLTLIGMNNGGYRINGGIGLAIDKPAINLRVSKSKEFQLIDRRISKFSQNNIERFGLTTNKVQVTNRFKSNICVEISGEMASNSGFGSGTIIRMACLEALHIINDISISENELVELSGRGGTSGIGIRTYFRGGFVFDIGHKSFAGHLPSSLRENIGSKSLLVEAGVSPSWKIGLCIPTDIKTLTQDQEVAFFKNATPINDAAVYKTLYHVVYGLYASLKENELDTFCQALIEIQKCKWKQLERSIYGKKLLEYEKLLYQSGAKAVGMSSLGPTLFFISENNERVMKTIKKNYPTNSLILFNAATINEGRNISI